MIPKRVTGIAQRSMSNLMRGDLAWICSSAHSSWARSTASLRWRRLAHLTRLRFLNCLSRGAQSSGCPTFLEFLGTTNLKSEVVNGVSHNPYIWSAPLGTATQRRWSPLSGRCLRLTQVRPYCWFTNGSRRALSGRSEIGVVVPSLAGSFVRHLAVPSRNIMALAGAQRGEGMRRRRTTCGLRTWYF